MPLDDLLHHQGGITGAHGVIFVGHRRTKQGHNAIAQDLIHRALKAVHGVHHVAEGGIEEVLRGLRVEVAN